MADRSVADINVGRLYQEKSAGDFGTLGDADGGSYITPEKSVAVNSPYQTPLSSFNGVQHISRYFTVGEVLGAPVTDDIPLEKFDDVMNNMKNLCYNVLDRLRERWDFDVLSVYRKEGSNHSTGLAADIVCVGADASKHAQMGAYAKDRLPVDQVWLERNASGKTHLHVKSSIVGSKGSADTATFLDVESTQRVNGLRVEIFVKDNIR